MKGTGELGTNVSLNKTINDSLASENGWFEISLESIIDNLVWPRKTLLYNLKFEASGPRFSRVFNICLHSNISPLSKSLMLKLPIIPHIKNF